ncbi:MAG: hypothetical protein Q8M23_03465, partial [Bacteroidales bacterium]|nr:hypothetical protein [Bacteroidales bacterium]
EPLPLSGSSYGVFASSSLSFAGYSASAGGYAMGRKSMVIVGFNTSLPDIVYFGDLRKGFQLAYRFYPQGKSSKLSLHMGPVAQMIFLKKYDNNTGGSSSLLAEGFMEYGMDWQVFSRLSIGNAIGFGVFYEAYNHPNRTDDGIVHGLNAKVSISLMFKLNR